MPLRKKIALSVIAILAVLQFLPINTGVPEVDPKGTFENLMGQSQELSLIKAACYDCHSYDTKYPIYVQIAPISFWLNSHIQEGRKKLNFSIWNSYSEKKQKHKIEECIEMVSEKKMPLLSYMIMHPEAGISDTQRAELKSYFEKIMSQ